MATRILLVRHGAPVGAETGRFIGHLDAVLSAQGEAQAEALARRLSGEPLAAVYSSDLARTLRTAEILAAPHRITPVAVSALREFAMGEWEGLTAAEIRARDGAGFAAWMASTGEFQFPGGENLRQVAARSWAAFERIVAGSEWLRRSDAIPTPFAPVSPSTSRMDVASTGCGPTSRKTR